jgi:type III restriction enzyme
MPDQFFEQPIRNSPYAYSGRHWELDADGQPTNNIAESRRRSAFITPVPKPKKRRQSDAKLQSEIVFQDEEGTSVFEIDADFNKLIQSAIAAGKKSV